MSTSSNTLGNQQVVAGDRLVALMGASLANNTPEEFDMRLEKYLQKTFDVMTRDWTNDVCRSPPVIDFFHESFERMGPAKKDCLNVVAVACILLNAKDRERRLESLRQLSADFERWSAAERDCLGNIYVADAITRL